MATPLEEIEAYVGSTHTANGHQLAVALTFAQSMVRELEGTIAEWEAAVRTLQRGFVMPGNKQPEQWFA